MADPGASAGIRGERHGGGQPSRSPRVRCRPRRGPPHRFRAEACRVEAAGSARRSSWRCERVLRESGTPLNIVKHTSKLNEHRAEPSRWKYFQWLALLFSEVYLDHFFHDPDKLLGDLNAHVEKFNADKPDRGEIPPYELPDLRKIACWNATGSGKTLLMHVNTLQYQHHLGLHGQGRPLNRIILLTPNR